MLPDRVIRHQQAPASEAVAAQSEWQIDLQLGLAGEIMRGFISWAKSVEQSLLKLCCLWAERDDSLWIRF